MWNRGSAVKCVFAGAVLASSIPEEFTFCWIGYLARDIFQVKHSEVKWRQLPWLRSDTLLPTCMLVLQCTKVERSDS